MAVLRTKVLWTGPSGVPEELLDVERIVIRRGIDIKHNTLDVILKNNPNEERPYVKSGTNQFDTEQPIEVYARYDDDGEGLDTDDNDNLVFSGRVVEFEMNHTADSTKLKVLCSDSSFIALNRLWVGDEEGTAPNLIKLIIDNINENIEDANKQITATVGGSIASTRSAYAASPTFPTTRVSKVFKPAFEVIQELSQTAATGEIVPYRFHIDRTNTFHWFYPDDSAQHVIVEGATTSKSATYQHPITRATDTVDDSNIHKVVSFKLRKSVYDITNFIIFKAGEDMNDVQILDYHYDATAGSPVIKDSFRNFENIARDMKSEGATETDANHKLTKTGGDTYSYPSNYGGGFVPKWNRHYNTTVTSNSTYNDAFKTEAIRRAKLACQNIFTKTGNPRFKGSIEVKGANIYDPNDGLVFSSPRAGIGVFLRISEVQHNIDKNGWFTTLTVDEELTPEE